MSCFNCYSTRKVDKDIIIDKIVHRGEQLRNAMVQTILKNDPLNADIVQGYCSKRSVKLGDLTLEDGEKFKAFLQGEFMSREDEIATLETLRLMSASELSKITDKTYRSDRSCDCNTCTDYRQKDLTCDIKRATEITEKIQERYKTEAVAYLQYVDSLKVFINNVILNEAGEKKVFNSVLCKDRVATASQTFFVDYEVPEFIIKSNKTKSKVDSGLKGDNKIRLCSRRFPQQEINFKQSHIHDVANLDGVNLREINLKFRFSVRNFKQKQLVELGCAKFNFGAFEVVKNFICNQELSLQLTESVPLTVGVLKVSVQLGCGRLYFGKEFLEAIKNNREGSVILGSEEWSEPADSVYYQPETVEVMKAPPIITKPSIPPLKIDSEPSSKRKITQSSSSLKIEKLTAPKTVLFGFIYISEAQFSREVINSYLTCQLFGQNDFCQSKLMVFGSNPVFNFSQQVPLVYDEDFLLNLRENFMVVEFLEKSLKDFSIGLCKLQLHQFYLTFRNPVIVKYLCERNTPVIGVDGWEAIFDPHSEEIVGKVQVLLALGTKEQIESLEKDRGFKKVVFKATSPTVTRKQKLDIGVQSEMEPKNNIETLLSQLMSQRPQNVHVESSTNTDPVLTNPEPIRNTSDLLESLQKALTGDSPEKSFFRARVAINRALHLPSRRKCKSRKSKTRSGKHEDILPSSYVTFEDYRGELRITPIIQKDTDPKWDYHCEVYLPIEYLTNNKKLMVFKVWRKSTNTNMMPNLQTDIVIGMATLDLTVLLAGLPTIQGWYNICDLSKKCNGQINIHVIPLDDISKYKKHKDNCCEVSREELPQSSSEDFSDEPNELLSRALKRKFTELDEITQRLRLRLSKVTNDESDVLNDELADEFEHDINTLCVEDDFDTINFEDGETSEKDCCLMQSDGKPKIDSLLERLSLFSPENSGRYVSGCSDSKDASNILNDLDHNSRPNIHTESSFSKEMDERFGNCLMSEKPME